MLEIVIAIVENGELETLSAQKKPTPKLKINIPKKNKPADAPRKLAVLENVRTTIFKSVESAPVKPEPPVEPVPAPPPPPPIEPPPPIAAPTPPPMHQDPVEEKPVLAPEPTPASQNDLATKQYGWHQS